MANVWTVPTLTLALVCGKQVPAWDDASVILLRGLCGSAMVRHDSNRSPDGVIGKETTNQLLALAFGWASPSKHQVDDDWTRQRESNSDIV